MRFYVDDDLVKVVRQSPAYPMQVMLNIYEFPDAHHDRDANTYPKVFEVDWVRGWRPAEQRLRHQPGPKTPCGTAV